MSKDDKNKYFSTNKNLNMNLSMHSEDENDFEDEIDIKLVKLLKMDKTPEPPDFLRQNILDGYKKEFRYKILWTKGKDYLLNNPFLSNDTVFIKGNLALASILLLFLVGTYFYINNKSVEISKNIEPQLSHQINYRGNSQENISKLKQAKKFYIEENEDPEINELIKKIYKKVSLETTKIITLDSSQNYNILINIKRDNDLLVISLNDSLGNYLCSKKYNLNADNNTKDLLEAIKTDLLYEFYLKE